MKGERWIDAEEFLRRLGEREDKEYGRLMFARSPLAPNVPGELEDTPHQSSVLPGKNSHSSGLGSFLKSQSDYEGHTNESS